MCKNERRSLPLRPEFGLSPFAAIISSFRKFSSISIAPYARTRRSGTEPPCSGTAGWILEYDMEGARGLLQQQGVRGPVTPEFLFDEGYLSWQSLSPGDQDLNAALHRRLAPLIEQDLSQYPPVHEERMAVHVAELKAAGWRKARKA